MTFDIITQIIIILGIFNFIMLIATHVAVHKLRELIGPASNRRYGYQPDMSITERESDDLGRTSAWAAGSYTGYVNITAIFPLLGILGTVLSLMQISGTEELSTNFSMALTTTAAGLICAMAFKLFDSTISSRLDRALDEADYIIHQHDKEKEKTNAPKAETRYRH